VKRANQDGTFDY